MFTTNRFWLKYGNEDDVVECTSKEWDTFDKAITYCRRYATGIKYVSCEILDEKGNVLYEDIAGVGETFYNTNSESNEEKKMLTKLEEARLASEAPNPFPVYAFGNGKNITWHREYNVKSMRGILEKQGYWLVAIFENGHRVAT